MFSEGGTNDATRWRHRDDAPHSSHTNTQPQPYTQTQPHTTRPAHTVLTVSKWAAPRPGPRDTHRDPPPSVSSISVRAANDPSIFYYRAFSTLKVPTSTFTFKTLCTPGQRLSQCKKNTHPVFQHISHLWYILMMTHCVGTSNSGGILIFSLSFSKYC